MEMEKLEVKKTRRRGHLAGNTIGVKERVDRSEYREGQKCVVKLTFKELEAKYNIPASTIRGYFHNIHWPKSSCGFSDGAKLCPDPR